MDCSDPTYKTGAGETVESPQWELGDGSPKDHDPELGMRSNAIFRRPDLNNPPTSVGGISQFSRNPLCGSTDLIESQDEWSTQARPTRYREVVLTSWDRGLSVRTHSPPDIDENDQMKNEK